jgi:glycosyltransferase involved in cell wall biosynthesis
MEGGGVSGMKIALVSDSIYPYHKGGKETRSYQLAKNLSKTHEVHFYTMKFWEGEEVIQKEGFYLHGICKEFPLYEKNRRSIKQGVAFGLACFKLLKEDFDILDADHMIYFHLFPAKLACWLKGKKFIITWHEVWGKEYWKEYLGWKGVFGYWIEKLSSKLPDKIISVSEMTKEKLIKELKVPEQKIVVIPNAIDIHSISKIKPAKESSDIIFAGRLLSHKNVEVLIRAMSAPALKDKKLLIIGDGPEREALESLAKELSLTDQITFKGFIEKHEDVLALIKSSKVFVLPSTREGFGISIIEANACSIPAITTSHKDNASKSLIKEGKNGFVCELNENDLAENILKALKQSKKMKKECVESAKEYDWSKVISKFEEVYAQC